MKSGLRPRGFSFYAEFGAFQWYPLIDRPSCYMKEPWIWQGANVFHPCQTAHGPFFMQFDFGWRSNLLLGSGCRPNSNPLNSRDQCFLNHGNVDSTHGTGFHVQPRPCQRCIIYVNLLQPNSIIFLFLSAKTSFSVHCCNENCQWTR